MLLDTHALCWHWLDDPRLTQRARQAIAAKSNAVMVSPASAWELTIKHRAGKWAGMTPILAQFERLMRRSGFLELPISIAHARAAGELAGHHKDPFDRLLIAQARVEADVLISADRVFQQYDIPVLWA